MGMFWCRNRAHTTSWTRVYATNETRAAELHAERAWHGCDNPQDIRVQVKNSLQNRIVITYFIDVRMVPEFRVYGVQNTDIDGVCEDAAGGYLGGYLCWYSHTNALGLGSAPRPWHASMSCWTPPTTIPPVDRIRLRTSKVQQ